MGVHHVAAVLLLGFLLVLPIALVDLPLGRAGGRGAGVPTVLSWIVLVYCAFRLAVFSWRARPRWTDGVFWAFSYVWLGLAGVAQVAADRNPLHTALARDVETVQFTMILLGFVSFELGRRLHGRVPRPSRAPGVAPTMRVVSRPRVLALSVLTLGLTPVLVAGLGGITTLFSSRQAINDRLAGSGLYSHATNATGGTLVTVANVLPFACLLSIVCLWRGHPELRRDAALRGAFTALVAANIVLNNPVSNPRYWVLGVLLTLVLTLRTLERPWARGALVAAYVLAATLVFGYLDATRTDDFGASAASQDGHRPVDLLLGKTDYGAVTDVGVAVRFVEHEGHRWGRQLLGAAAFWYPRDLWPDKPPNTAELLAGEVNFPNRNLDTPLWAEGYVDFGLVGTAAVMLAFGLIGRSADAAVERAEKCPVRHATPGYLIAVAFIGYESFLLRGSLLQAMAKIVFVAVVLVCSSTSVRVPDTARANGSVPQEKGEG